MLKQKVTATQRNSW